MTEGAEERREASRPGEEELRALGHLLMGRPPEPAADWEAVVDLARRHAVAPLLYWQLKARAQDRDRTEEGPAVAVQELRDNFYAAAARAIVAERQLAGALKALSEAEVEVVVVKGTAVAVAYPDPALRVYSDLDLLVEEAALDRAEAALEKAGYHYSQPRAWWLAHFKHLPPMSSEEGPLPLELHWRLDDEGTTGRLPVEDLWQRAVPWAVGGQPALRLEAVDAALHLCRHAAVQHRLHLGLRPLCDLAQVTAPWSPADWDTLADRAADYGLARPVYLLLTLMGEVLGRPAPAKVLLALRPAGDAGLPAGVAGRLLRLEDDPAAAVPPSMVWAQGREGQPGRLRDLLGHLFPPREGLAAVYGVPADSPRIWLTYLRRPADLLRRYGRAGWGMLRGNPASRQAWERETWLQRWLRGKDGSQ